MPETKMLSMMDRLIKPKEWYAYRDLIIKGFQLIASKDDQKYAGLLVRPPHQPDKPKFGLNPVKPYRDYYGTFKLQTRLLKNDLSVLFAIGYTINSRIVTVDDYSKFGWLRLATGLENVIYPNLSHQKQLLEYLLAHSKQPKFVVTRVYHYLQFDLYHELTEEILKQETGSEHPSNPC